MVASVAVEAIVAALVSAPPTTSICTGVQLTGAGPDPSSDVSGMARASAEGGLNSSVAPDIPSPASMTRVRGGLATSRFTSGSIGISENS